MIRFFLFAILMGASPWAQAQGLVGNNGEGILADGGLYLRDFYEQNLHLQPFFGHGTNTFLKEKVNSLQGLGLSAGQKSLLVRKLSDADQAFPCLGLLLIQGLSSFQFSFEELPLALTDDEDTVRTIPKDRRVALANRYGPVIRIHRPSWNRLPDTHKIGLLIHEVVFAFQRYDCKSANGLSRQCVGTTRNIVSILFNEKINPIALKAAIVSSFQSTFDLNSKLKSCQTQPLQAVLTIFTSFPLTSTYNRQDFGENKGLPIPQQIRSFCQKNKSLFGLEYRWALSLKAPSIRVILQKSDRPDEVSLFLDETRAMMQTPFYSFASYDHCLETLQESLDSP